MPYAPLPQKGEDETGEAREKGKGLMAEEERVGTVGRAKVSSSIYILLPDFWVQTFLNTSRVGHINTDGPFRRPAFENDLHFLRRTS